jgi:hypothetical protein
MRVREPPAPGRCIRGMRLGTLVVLLVLLLPASATAGGWATVGVDSLPDGVHAGEPWRVEVTVLQHGRTPLAGVHPRVIATRGLEQQVFPARVTDRIGVYGAEVVFATAGEWEYQVDDGFGQTHTFPPVRVRSDSPSLDLWVSALDFLFASF